MAKADLKSVGSKRPLGRQRIPRLSASTAGDAGQHSAEPKAVPGVINFAQAKKAREDAGR